MSQQTWEFINTFAPWLAGIGALLAVIISLYLARRDQIIRLRVSAGVSWVFIKSLQGVNNEPDVIDIRVSNLGRRSVLVNGLGWQVGCLKKKQFWQERPQTPNSSELPIKLHDGDEAFYLIPLQDFDNNFLNQYRLKIFKKPFFLRIRTIRIVALTSVGKRFSSRINRNLKDHIADYYRKNPQA